MAHCSEPSESRRTQVLRTAVAYCSVPRGVRERRHTRTVPRGSYGPHSVTLPRLEGAAPVPEHTSRSSPQRQRDISLVCSGFSPRQLQQPQHSSTVGGDVSPRKSPRVGSTVYQPVYQHVLSPGAESTTVVHHPTFKKVRLSPRTRALQSRSAHVLKKSSPSPPKDYTLSGPALASSKIEAHYETASPPKNFRTRQQVYTQGLKSRQDRRRAMQEIAVSGGMAQNEDQLEAQFEAERLRTSRAKEARDASDGQAASGMDRRSSGSSGGNAGRDAENGRPSHGTHGGEEFQESSGGNAERDAENGRPSNGTHGGEEFQEGSGTRRDGGRGVQAGRNGNGRRESASKGGEGGAIQGERDGRGKGRRGSTARRLSGNADGSIGGKQGALESGHAAVDSGNGSAPEVDSGKAAPAQDSDNPPATAGDRVGGKMDFAAQRAATLKRQNALSIPTLWDGAVRSGFETDGEEEKAEAVLTTKKLGASKSLATLFAENNDMQSDFKEISVRVSDLRKRLHLE